MINSAWWVLQFCDYSPTNSPVECPNSFDKFTSWWHEEKYQQFERTRDETEKHRVLKLCIEKMRELRPKVGEGLRDRLHLLNFKSVFLEELNENNISGESVKDEKHILKVNCTISIWLKIVFLYYKSAL